MLLTKDYLKDLNLKIGTIRKILKKCDEFKNNNNNKKSITTEQSKNKYENS